MTVSLRELQEYFQAYILDEKQEVLNSISSDQDRRSERIDIYRKGYVLRLLEILEKDFPLLREYIGENIFEKISVEYIKTYPSTHFNVCTFSRHFSQFLTDSNCEAHWSEMAAFEWILSCVLDAEDAPHIGIDQLGSIAGESWPFIQFDFHPSAEQRQFRYNSPLIVYALLQKEEVPELIDFEEPRDWIIWRFNMQSYFESVTREQMWMIKAIREGKTFSEICEGLCQWLSEEEVAMYAAGSLRNWIEKGLFSAVRVMELVCE